MKRFTLFGIFTQLWNGRGGFYDASVQVVVARLKLGELSQCGLCLPMNLNPLVLGTGGVSMMQVAGNGKSEEKSIISFSEAATPRFLRLRGTRNVR